VKYLYHIPTFLISNDQISIGNYCPFGQYKGTHNSEKTPRSFTQTFGFFSQNEKFSNYPHQEPKKQER
jgi:hypothetical protein